jgi:hypothetical protein
MLPSLIKSLGLIAVLACGLSGIAHGANAPATAMIRGDWTPFSLIKTDGSWSFYSADANVIRGYALAPDMSTWLATDGGVKKISQTGGLDRLYTMCDGLPSNRIRAIAADGDDVWCIAYSDASYDSKCCFCHLGPADSKWQTLRTVTYDVDNLMSGPYFYIGLPPGFPTPKDAHLVKIQRSADGAIWLLGDGNALRYAP